MEEDLLGGKGVEARGGLVQEQQHRVAQQLTPYAQALLLASTQSSLFGVTCTSQAGCSVYACGHNGIKECWVSRTSVKGPKRGLLTHWSVSRASQPQPPDEGISSRLLLLCRHTAGQSQRRCHVESLPAGSCLIRVMHSAHITVQNRLLLPRYTEQVSIMTERSLPDCQLGVKHVLLLHIRLLVRCCSSGLTIHSDIASQLHAYTSHSRSVKDNCGRRCYSPLMCLGMCLSAGDGAPFVSGTCPASALSRLVLPPPDGPMIARSLCSNDAVITVGVLTPKLQHFASRKCCVVLLYAERSAHTFQLSPPHSHFEGSAWCLPSGL